MELQELQAEVGKGIARLPTHLRVWADAHLVPPRPIRAARDVQGTRWAQLILVTDDTGAGDSSCRVVYDPDAGAFGLVTEIENGPLWYMGAYGGFDSAVVSM